MPSQLRRESDVDREHNAASKFLKMDLSAKKDEIVKVLIDMLEKGEIQESKSKHTSSLMHMFKDPAHSRRDEFDGEIKRAKNPKKFIAPKIEQLDKKNKAAAKGI